MWVYNSDTSFLWRLYQGLPYLRRKSGTNSTNEFEGFIPDLMQALSRRAYFSFTITPVRDGRFGALQSDGSWNGMIGEVLRGVRTLYVHRVKASTVVSLCPVCYNKKLIYRRESA